MDNLEMRLVERPPSPVGHAGVLSRKCFMVDDRITLAVQELAQEGKLSCADAFRVAQDLSVAPSAVGEAVDALGVRLARCQLGLFGYGEPRRIVEPAAAVSPELARAIRAGLVQGRLPCEVAWAIAARCGMTRLQVSNAAEKLGVRISQCQLGAF